MWKINELRLKINESCKKKIQHVKKMKSTCTKCKMTTWGKKRYKAQNVKYLKFK